IVVLNASSSLTYAVGAMNNERRVALTGEAYFEVAKDAEHPFIVNANGSSIRVTGTRFNLKAYNEDAATRVLLVEGAVTLNNNIHLRPGDEATVLSNRSTTIAKGDTSVALAWKNDEFNFK